MEIRNCLPEETPGEREILELAMDAGTVLLENDAEIFRVEETMARICRHYGVESPELFVLTNGVFATGGGTTRVKHVPVRSTRLDKVAAVNQLSRDIEKGRYTIHQARQRLEEIREMPGKPAWLKILACALAAGCFCCMAGGAMAGLSGGGRRRRSSAGADSVGLRTPSFPYDREHPLRRAGDLLVPGDLCAFARPQPEPHDYRNHSAPGAGYCLYQRHSRPGRRRLYFRGRAASGRHAGVRVRGHRGGRGVYAVSQGVWRCHALTLQVLAAILGTVAFSALFGAPRKYYLLGGVTGGAAWLIYSGLLHYAGCTATEATLLATLGAVFLSRIFAVAKQCPVTIFLVAGLIPLAPGAGIYWTAYYLVTDQLALARSSGFAALKAAFAIVLGIVAMFELPGGLFRTLAGRRKE